MVFLKISYLKLYWKVIQWALVHTVNTKGHSVIRHAEVFHCRTLVAVHLCRSVPWWLMIILVDRSTVPFMYWCYKEWCIHMHGQYVRIIQLLGQKCRCALPYDCMCTLHVHYKTILLAKLHSNWYCIQNIVIFLTHGNSHISTFVSIPCNAIYIFKPHSAYDVNDYTKFILALTRFILLDN